MANKYNGYRESSISHNVLSLYLPNFMLRQVDYIIFNKENETGLSCRNIICFNGRLNEFTNIVNKCIKILLFNRK